MKRPWPCLMTGTIVSFVNSPTAISSYRVRFLSPVVGNTNYTVKNSCWNWFRLTSYPSSPKFLLIFPGTKTFLARVRFS